jgi:two-component system, NarL family, sensor histidine kinase DevS
VLVKPAKETASDQQVGHLLGAIFSACPDAVLVVDDAGTIVLSNPAVTSLFGYYPEELVGEPVDVLLPPDNQARHSGHLRDFFAAPRARHMGVGRELAGRHRDGTQFAVEVSLTPVEIRGAQYAAAFVRDGRERQGNIDRLHAVNEVTQSLLAGTKSGEVLPLVARRARRLTHSDASWIVTPAGPGNLIVSAVDGNGTQVLLGATLSPDTSRSAEVMRTGDPEIIEDLFTATNVPDAVVGLNLGPGLYVPLIADERRLGTLVLGRVRGSTQFGPLDIALAMVFASSTAAAIELGEVRAELERTGIVAEEERIAHDLHDTVIQDLFGVGLSLQAARSSVTGPIGERIDEAVDRLDTIIREIRNTIFRLPRRTAGTRGLHDEMLRLVDKYSEELGFTPRVGFHCPVDAVIPDAVAAQLVQVVGEALSNTARHAQATSADIVLEIQEGWLSFSLVDDGIGPPNAPTAGQGLRNMSARAHNLGGACTVSRNEPTGTIVEWRVPI